MNDTPDRAPPPDLRTINRVLPYLWPVGDPVARARVVGALFCLFLAKVATVITPVFFKGAVDALAGEDPTGSTLLLLGPAALVLGYGTMRLLSVGFAQLRDVIFTRVGQRALRRLAKETFEHVHALSLRYHITRKTGGLSRIIERGVKGVDFLLRFMLFSIIPLMLELAMVAVIFATIFGTGYVAIVVTTIVLYIVFTFRVTEWRVAIRKRMNDQDTDANQKAIDSLLNFETVKYFGAEGREAARYDAAMAGYEEGERIVGL
ncbi:MAG: ABC transporter transmembrane domain-containing protein, partial [Pseudomonadota bacterium]